MNKIILLVLFSLPVKIFSQDTLLTLQRTIKISMENNFDIRILNNLSKQAENNNTAGNAGMLPSIDANLLYFHSSYSLEQKYATSPDVNTDASVSKNMIADIGAAWTIFDGTKMFSTRSRLSEQSALSQDQLKIQIENSLVEVIESYYAIVRQQQLLKLVKEELLLTEERVNISERKMTNGSGSRLDWLQAKTENNRQRSAKLLIETESQSERINLNKLLGRNIESAFSVEDTVIVTYNPSFEDLKRSVITQNNFLNFYRRNKRIAELGLKETKALRSPIIKFNAHYIYSKNTNEAGYSLLNKSYGFNYGATATIPLFHGSNISGQIKNSKLEFERADIFMESVTAEVNADLYKEWLMFKNNLELLQLEEQNIIYAREVFSISHERYRIGVSNSVEQYEAQRTFEEATTRLIDARYNSKLSETMLRKLNGELVK